MRGGDIEFEMHKRVYNFALNLDESCSKGMTVLIGLSIVGFVQIRFTKLLG
jgi:hypothetical protein